MVPMTRSTPRRPRPRRRWTVAVAAVVGGLLVLGAVGEVVLRGVVDDRIEAAAADLPTGVTVTRDGAPALWQVATGQAALRVAVSPGALTETARSVTDLPGLRVAPEDGGLVAQMPLSVAGSEQTVDVLLSVAEEDGQAVLRADTVRFAGLSLPMATVADQLGDERLDRLAEGVTFPERGSQVTVSSVQATEDGLELGAEVALRG